MRESGQQERKRARGNNARRSSLQQHHLQSRKGQCPPRRESASAPVEKTVEAAYDELEAQLVDEAEEQVHGYDAEAGKRHHGLAASGVAQARGGVRGDAPEHLRVGGPVGERGRRRRRRCTLAPA